MDELVRWLGKQLDEDERIAREAGGDSWRRQDHPSDTVAIYDSKGEPVVYDEGSPTEEQQSFIVRHDPARVLRETDAKRQIIAEHDTEGWKIGDRLHDCQWNERPCRTLRLLALPYADRPSYREEWAP